MDMIEVDEGAALHTIARNCRCLGCQAGSMRVSFGCTYVMLRMSILNGTWGLVSNTIEREMSLEALCSSLHLLFKAIDAV